MQPKWVKNTGRDSTSWCIYKVKVKTKQNYSWQRHPPSAASLVSLQSLGCVSPASLNGEVVAARLFVIGHAAAAAHHAHLAALRHREPACIVLHGSEYKSLGFLHQGEGGRHDDLWHRGPGGGTAGGAGVRGRIACSCFRISYS